MKARWKTKEGDPLLGREKPKKLRGKDAEKVVQKEKAHTIWQRKQKPQGLRPGKQKAHLTVRKEREPLALALPLSSPQKRIYKNGKNSVMETKMALIISQKNLKIHHSTNANECSLSTNFRGRQKMFRTSSEHSQNLPAQYS